MHGDVHVFMRRKDRLLAKARNNPNSVRFRNVGGPLTIRLAAIASGIPHGAIVCQSSQKGHKRKGTKLKYSLNHIMRRRKLSKDMFDGFAVNVFLDEDGDYLAHLVEMPNVSAFSDTPEKAMQELALAWRGVKESYRKHNETLPKAPSRDGYEAPFNVPVDGQLYHALANEAAEAGVSLYALVTQKLKSAGVVVQED